MTRRWLLVLLLACGASALWGQAADTPVLEVQQSTGFVEVLLPELGWRQAVIGRQVPAGSVMTAWLDATARLAYGDSILTLDQLSHVKVIDISASLIRLSVEAGGITIEVPTTACEIEFRGMVIRVEKGKASLGDDSLAVQSGSAVVQGAGPQPLPVAAGAKIALLSPAAGPIFAGASR